MALNKVGNNNHYTTCNTQLSKYSSLRTGDLCNCGELSAYEVAKQKITPLPPRMKTSVPFSSFTSARSYVYNDIDLSAHMHEMSKDQEKRQAYGDFKYKKFTTIADIILDSLESLKQTAIYYNLQKGQLDFDFKDFISDLDVNIEQHKFNNPELLNMAKPKIKLVKIGMDIDLRYISSTSFVVKPLKGSHFNGHTLKKDTFWVFSEKVPDTPPFYLFEFPDAGLKPNADLILLVDPYIPEDDFLTTEEYHKWGIKIMRKFDIKDARKLLDTRKNIFNLAPTATNTILLFQLMDAIVLNDFKTGTLDLDKTGEKNLLRLEKLKNLALDTKFNEERKSAVDKAFIQFDIVSSKKEEKAG